MTVVQVQHAVALDCLVRIVQEHRARVAAEESHSFAQNHWGDVLRGLVDRAGQKRLPPRSPETVACELLGERDTRLDGVGGGREWRSGGQRCAELAPSYANTFGGQHARDRGAPGTTVGMASSATRAKRVEADDFVIEQGGKQLVLYVDTLVVDEPRRVVVARLDGRDVVSVEQM